MPWSDVFSSLTPRVRGIIAVCTVVPAVIGGLYVAMVVAPTVPAITEAVKQGRSFTLIPFGIGEYEAPEIKECKNVVEHTNDSIRSLEIDLGKSMDLLKSQQIIVQDAMNKRSAFLQLPSQQTVGMSWTTQSMVEQLSADVDFQEKSRDEISGRIENRIETAIKYMDDIKNYCIHYH